MQRSTSVTVKHSRGQCHNLIRHNHVSQHTASGDIHVHNGCVSSQM